MLKNQTPPASLQDTFNRIWQHFIVEKNPRCIDILGRCQYRYEGRGCAIGILLPDHIVDRMSNVAIASLFQSPNGATEWLKNAGGVSELSWLQAIHDNAINPNESTANYMERGLTEFALFYNLTIPAAPAAPAAA